MDITVYKLFHVIGILLVFQGIGAAIASSAGGSDAPWKRVSMAGHGIGLLLIVVAGFGMAAKIGVMGALPSWIWVKLAVWLSLGALPFVLARRPAAARLAWGAALGLGTLAAVMGIFKPF